MAECIHGFEDGMCDICFPKKVPEPVPVVAVATRSGQRAAPRVRRVPGAPAVSKAPPIGLPPYNSRRVYHVTHSRNLESILLDGAIRSIGSGADPDVDVSAPVVREMRAASDIGEGRTVADFVPFMLSPDADRWSELRDGATGSHWSTAARLTPPTEYVILVVGTAKLGADVVIADGDASAPATAFTSGEPAKAVARAAQLDPELGQVELLVPGQVPLDAVLLIGVPNEPMRSRVRRMIEAAEVTPPRVVVHPPWFTPTED